MAKTNFKSVDEYIATHSDAVQVILRRVRSAIRRALPSAEEVISYQIPAYKLHGVRVIYFAGWNHHYSLYPARATLIAAFKGDLAPYEVAKGTIRFPYTLAVPTKLIGRIAKFLAKEAGERAGPKRVAYKKRK